MTTPDPTAAPDLTRAIADFAFASQHGATHSSRPLAWLSPEDLKIDLSDPRQRRFGDYELLEQLGEGGMGVVYRARQHGLERDVAVKLLAAGPWASDEFVARFRREARHAARMQHPNIVEIYEFGHRDGLNYFSMRLVEGPGLAEQLAATGPMPEREAAKCVRLLAEAMDYAHRLDVLHLDLKPANVLIGAGGEPLIADFGLARRIDAGGSSGSDEISGTPSYMAPEQARHQSHPLTASTDIYGLGAILYEVLTGRPPFSGEDARATLECVMTAPPAAPRALRPGLSSDLEAICLKCLEKQPAARYATARDLADDLQRFLDGHPVSACPLDRLQRLRRWRRREPKLALAVGSAVLALGMGIAATASAWQQARLAQADAEYLGLATILPTARNTSIHALSGRIRTRLSDDARQERAQALAASSDPRDWIVAGLIYQTLGEPDVVDLGEQQFRRAIAALPNDRFALIAAIRACGWSWRWWTDEPRVGATLRCPVPDAAARLVRADPENLFAHLSLIDPPYFDQNRGGELLWKFDHDPVVRARLTRLIANAAKATTWDDGSGRILAAKAKAYGVDYFPMPMGGRFQERWQEATASAENLRSGLSGTWSGAWDLQTPPNQVLSRLCNPQLSGQRDRKFWADCIRIYRTLADSKSGIAVNVVGWLGLSRLARGTPLEAEMDDRLRRFHWLREQELWSRDPDPLASSRQFTRDVAVHGELEANLRQADRLGIARKPPPEWKPRDPATLKLSSF